MNKFSLLLITKNEEKKLKEWGSWLPKLTCINEIIVVDESEDNTVKILKSFVSKHLKIKVYRHHLDDNFSQQRNFALSHCQNDWVFFLDADEKPSSETIDYLNNLTPQNSYSYSFTRKLVYFHRQLSYGQCLYDQPVKLFNRHQGTFVNPVHEIWQSNSQIINTQQIILHQSFDDIYQLLEKINRYSSIRANDLFHQHHQTNLFEIIIYPSLKFIDLYFFRLSFLDGVPGLILSLCFSLNSFLVRSKLWHLSQK